MAKAFQVVLFVFGCLLPAIVFAAQDRAIDIERVEILGVTVFPNIEIESTLEIGPGEKLERIKVVRTAENIQALYRVHGYEEVSIESRLVRKKNEDGKLEDVLEFKISEGRPTRVSEIKFVPGSIRDKAFQSYWKRIERGLMARVGLSAGDIFDQEKISLAKRGLQDLLASEEFIGAGIDDVRITSSTAPGQVAQVAKDSAARWVSIEFHVDLGDRVTFGFRGNTVLSLSQLSSLIEEQRLLGFGKDYVGAIKLRIEDEYRSLGYTHIQIVPYTFERPEQQERHITYEISEGPRAEIESLDFDGNIVFSSSVLREQFFLRSSTELQHGHYVEKEVQKSADLLVEWMKSKGYLAAKVVTISVLEGKKFRAGGTGSEVRNVRVIIYIYEGDQTFLDSVSFSGLTVFSVEELKMKLGVREGEPLNLFAFSEGIETVKAAYRAEGYLSFRIVNEGKPDVVKYSEENRVAEISLIFSEGPRYRVSRIVIEGLSLTREQVVRRELLLRDEEILREPALLESEARLRRLGIFSSVTVRLIEDADREGYKIIRISLQEGTPGVVAGGFGFRNDLGGRVFGQVAYANIGGRNQTLSFYTSVNRRIEDYRFIEHQFQVTYIWPWFLMNNLTFRPSFSVTGSQYNKFDATTVSLAATWEKRLVQRPNLTGLFTYSLERINQFNAEDAVDEQEIRVGSVTPSLRLDMRDNPLSPSSGLFAWTSFEISAPAFFSQKEPFPVGYTRFQLRTDYYVPVMKDVTWFFSFRSGIERSTELDVAIPLIKQFALGGPGSLRGFKEQELNKQDTRIVGTLSYVNYRTQLDLPFSGALRFGPFVDAANLIVDRFSFGALRYGAGVGFHYQTPVGPVNLDWGFKIAPQVNEDHFRFHFSIGVI